MGLPFPVVYARTHFVGCGSRCDTARIAKRDSAKESTVTFRRAELLVVSNVGHMPSDRSELGRAVKVFKTDWRGAKL